MQRQRGELVPVAEALADLPGPVKALREAPPPCIAQLAKRDRVLSAWHCHVNRVGPQRPAWIPFQAAALAVSHTLNASFRNRLNVSLLHK